MSQYAEDLMDDLFDAAEGPARAFDAGDEFDEWDGADEGDDEFLGRLIGAGAQALGGLLGADEFDEDGFDEYDEFDTGDGFDVDSFEDLVADALDAGDSDEFLRRIRNIASRVGRAARGVGRAVGSAARVVGPIASMIPLPQAQLIGRVANVAGRLLADGADEFEAIDELLDSFDDDAIDAAAPVIAGLTIRRTMPNLAGAPRQVRRQAVRNVTQATRTLVRRQGAPAARAVPRIARAAQRRRVPTRRIGQTVRATAQRVARSPRQAQQLARPLTPTGARRAGPVAAGHRHTSGACPHCGAGSRRIRLQGPVTITIQSR
ncbi:hypothetical protein [Pseudogulbenkiania sp. MAI-1]|uniref:hypothetical protein n=1 Tax=Pseudogulbenkiania sp. MAI-1 TaxID=990370 RepID=UPI00045EC0D5|nr:hypothetical protein [Pseudogulbenkiania sp. MAI-1]